MVQDVRIAICEDEEVFAGLLREHLERFFAQKDIEVQISIYTSAKPLLHDFAAAGDFDVLFMDINLNAREDGVKVSARIRERDSDIPIIFVTSLENRAIDGYDVGAFGFVVKNKLRDKLPGLLDKLYRQHFHKNTITIREKTVSHVVNVKDIFYAESEGRTTLVHIRSSVLHDMRSITAFSELLSKEDFVETHKSVFVNITCIKRVNENTVVLSDGSVLPVSRRNRKNVMLAIMRKVGGDV